MIFSLHEGDASNASRAHTDDETSMSEFGRLIPRGGGDVIPLLHERLTIGRRDSCDICLRFPNVSSLHCELTFKNGCWVIQDNNSKNGVKVNGDKLTTKKVLHPGDLVSIAK